MIDINTETLNQLRRIADALEKLANGGEPTAPDMRKPIESFRGFDWESIGASVINADQDGPTVVEYAGTLWTRRSPQNKFDSAIWFSRAFGKDAEGNVKYLRLISFQTIKDADPLPAKAAALAGKPAPEPARLPTVQPPATTKAAPMQAPAAQDITVKKVIAPLAPAALKPSPSLDLLIDGIHAHMDLYYRMPLISEDQVGQLAPIIESAFPTGDHEAKRHAALKAITGHTSLKEIDITQASLLWHWLKPFKDATKHWAVNAESARELLKLVAELDKQNQLPLA